GTAARPARGERAPPAFPAWLHGPPARRFRLTPRALRRVWVAGRWEGQRDAARRLKQGGWCGECVTGGFVCNLTGLPWRCGVLLRRAFSHVLFARRGRRLCASGVRAQVQEAPGAGCEVTNVQARRQRNSGREGVVFGVARGWGCPCVALLLVTAGEES